MHWGCAAVVTGRPKASSQPVVRGRVISNFSAPDMLFLECCLEDLERRCEQLQQHISGPSNGCVGAGNVADIAKKRARSEHLRGEHQCRSYGASSHVAAHHRDTLQ